ncbi:serine hydroxymethyltransferase [Candidatus Roizmanbacteria bacterium CG22_combo_CG10-13_8_21_14_all_38_20]|uniref:Serine hydroxymethyltransferase n=1 Tax=Candidatus Roizmanbacteria bacterium CG22_combo_CG10-13_8_21_14_all_38_20 TaxID=1974862 RepID=A0A2H0BVS6_9BACT|nr:serine hydroxymethyltransferase [Candidatus Microgenomates bacterium]PIP61793.1 MAG: serine hydroxymethyltransferase [Candidatus Roizmanbacteria bacterium CG22_combo_CG10-13_8_21_14_all_38_20]PJC31638.1 MAG: serine hydroxymethyltransferase [Candidatus Roizmanbacteria bacterium CG_4_9_14_0_2_um_filter_38_17]
MLKQKDREIHNIIKAEAKRLNETLMMIPSENYAPSLVHEAVGSILINKYSEGQPFRRYYQGMTNVDQLEDLVEKRVLDTFKLDPAKWQANVQPYSGSPANAAIFMALLNPGDLIMPMYLKDGGHISHGWSFKGKNLAFSSKFFKVEFYHVDEKTLVFDYAKVAKEIKKAKPKIVVSGGTAYPRDINHKALGQAAHAVGAYYLADISHEAGLIAGGVMASPFKYADVVMFTTHKTLRGPRGAVIVAKSELIKQIDMAVFPGLQGGPHNHTIAGIGVALKIASTKSFAKYAGQIVKNAQALAFELEKQGFDVVTGGTDKHLVLLDLRNKGISGNIPAIALEHAGIVCNFNTVPYDTGSPLYPSGLRLGTPGLTTRKMKEKEMKIIAKWIGEVVNETLDYKLPEKGRKEYVQAASTKLAKNKTILKIRKEVKALCKKFAIPK